MTCRETTEFILDYLDGNLAVEVVIEFEIHMKKCGGCAEYIESYRKTVTLTRTLGSHHAAETAVPEELVQAILAARKKA